jgi:hypothetical protein
MELPTHPTWEWEGCSDEKTGKGKRLLICD